MKSHFVRIPSRLVDYYTTTAIQRKYKERSKNELDFNRVKNYRALFKRRLVILRMKVRKVQSFKAYSP